jgi:hypothetical protein
LENCAGGVHDQLWQKTAVEEMEEIGGECCSLDAPLSMGER